jgi:hypothetical protein
MIVDSIINRTMREANELVEGSFFFGKAIGRG